MAGCLNLLLGTNVTAWEVSCAIGRHPVRFVQLTRKTLVAELWHNPDGDFTWLVSALKELISVDEAACDEGNWPDVAIRLAVLWGIVSQLRAAGVLAGDGKVDISLTAGDFSGVMGGWYAKQLGLPIDTIICCCKENSALWELVHQGQMRTDRLAQKTDARIPVGLERLIYEAGGTRETERYLEASRRGGLCCPGEACLETIRGCIHVSVVGQRRAEETIPQIFGAHGYSLSSQGALCFAGLQDYRVISGENRVSLILSENSPHGIGSV